MELEKKQDKLVYLDHSLGIAMRERDGKKTTGCFIYGLGIILIGFIIFMISYDPESEFVDFLFDAPWVLLIFPIAFIALLRHNKSSKKKSINIKDIQQHKSDLIKEIDSIESVLEEM